MLKINKFWKGLTIALLCSFSCCIGSLKVEAKVPYRENSNGVTNKPVASQKNGAPAKSTPKDVKKDTPAKEKLKAVKEKKQKETAVNPKRSSQSFSQGDKNWKIKLAQQKLEFLGISKEKPSGVLTETTGKALMAFQKQYKLPETGKLDNNTYNKLIWIAFTKEGINDVQGKDIVNSASKYKGVPYVFGGTTPKGFDCSGYVQFIFKKHNALLPRVADEQVLKGLFVTQRQLKPGDLVFFTTYEPGASHVGIYAGNGMFWHTSSSRGVMLSSLNDVYWKPRYYGARRVLVSNGEL